MTDRERGIARPATRPSAGSRPSPTLVLAGLSFGAYTASLLSVTNLQSASDAATIELRAPAAEALTGLDAGHGSIEQRLAEARARLSRAGGAYADTTATLQDLQARIDALIASVDRLEVGTLALPTRLDLPAAPGVPAAVPRPTTHATTGASGG
jgi:hypothetical protein